MSDGGGKSVREYEQESVSKRVLGGDEFGRAIAKIAVAQICESEGYQSFQQSALDTLSNVAVRYVESLGKAANFLANSAGRTECNVFDIIQSLEDLGSAQGFSGASHIDGCLASSGTFRDITQYVNEAEENPFVYDVPHFPIVKDRKLTPSFLQVGVEPPAENIPAWLPAFPDSQTYTNMPMLDERIVDDHVHADRADSEGRHEKEERAVFNLQKRFGFNGTEGPPSVDIGDAVKAKRAAESNPFLAPPLRFEEKEVSPVFFPVRLMSETVSEQPIMENYAVEDHVVENHDSENHVLAVEAFSSAISAMQNDLNGSADGEGRVISSQRPPVHFRIRVGRTALDAKLNLIDENENLPEATSLVSGDDQNDNRKRRAEQIVKASLENPHKLAQL